MKKVYTIFDGDELDSGAAYLQAAAALDQAALYAVECRDVESLAGIAGLWMELAKGLGKASDRPPLESDDGMVGFCIKEENE